LLRITVLVEPFIERAVSAQDWAVVQACWVCGLILPEDTPAIFVEALAAGENSPDVVYAAGLIRPTASENGVAVDAAMKALTGTHRDVDMAFNLLEDRFANWLAQEADDEAAFRLGRVGSELAGSSGYSLGFLTIVYCVMEELDIPAPWTPSRSETAEHLRAASREWLANATHRDYYRIRRHLV
jgi:hypothetical protein